jgi:hypothetical protein
MTMMEQCEIVDGSIPAILISSTPGAANCARDESTQSVNECTHAREEIF